MMNLVLILMLANCGDLIVKSLMKLLKETLENHLAWNKSLIVKTVKIMIMVCMV